MQTYTHTMPFRCTSRRKSGRIAFVFDLDGTLIDSASDIALAANCVLAEFGGKPLPTPRIVNMVGGGAPKLLERAFATAQIDMPSPQTVLERFLVCYHSGPSITTRPYPGVTNMLFRMRRAGHPLAVCTNKPRKATDAILERLGWNDTFGSVIAGDDLPVKKPDPSPLFAALAQIDSAPYNTLYVGDTKVDVDTARNAGIPVAVLTHGYAHEPASTLGADVLLTTVRPLLGLIGQ